MEEFKLAIFWIGAIFSIIGGVIACRIKHSFSYWIFAIMIVSLAFPRASIHFFSDQNYRQTTRGIEVEILDLCAITLAIVMFLRKDLYRLTFRLPTTIPFFLVILVACISWLAAKSEISNPLVDYLKIRHNLEYKVSPFRTGIYPLFEISKLLRGYFIFWVTANFMKDQRSVRTMLHSFCAIVLYFTAVALYQRYVKGVYRVDALFDMNNLNCFAGMLGSFVVAFAFQRRRLAPSAIYWFTGLCALLVIILTVSRSSLAGYLLSLGVISIMCLRRFSYSKNYAMLAAAAVASTAFLLKSWNTLAYRFFYKTSIAGSMEIRDIFNDEALMMGRDHFWGVGPGNFSAYSVNDYSAHFGYFGAGTLAHNIWFLTLGELGYIGLAVFVVFWLRFFQILFKNFYSRLIKTSDFYYTALVGILGVMIVLQFQSMFHFSYRVSPIFFVTHMLIGLTARLYMVKKGRLTQT